MLLNDINDESIVDEEKHDEKLIKSKIKETQKTKSKVRKIYSARETLLLKALGKQRKLSEAWCDELQTTNVSLKRSNEKLQNYKLSNSGQFEMAVEAEASRRLKEISQPLEKAIQTNVNTVICMLKNLTDMKMLVSSLNQSTHLVKPLFTGLSQANTSNQKPRVVERRRHIVHPMVKGIVLQPAMVNISRLSLSDHQIFIKNATSKRKKQPEVLAKCKIIHKETPTKLTEHSESSDVAVPPRKRKKYKSYYSSTNNQLYVHNSEENCGTKNAKGNSDEENINKVVNLSPPLRIEDPLEGPSWLYNGRKKKTGQNRKQVLDRIKKGDKAPLEFRVYVDSSSDTEVENKYTAVIKKKPRRKRIKSVLQVKKSLVKLSHNQFPITESPKLGCNTKHTGVNCNQHSFQEALPMPRNCSVVLKREQDNFGISSYQMDNKYPPSDKENIPPVTESAVTSDLEEIKLKNIAVVVEDIMKNHPVRKSKSIKFLAKKSTKNKGKMPHIVARLHNVKRASKTGKDKVTIRKWNLNYNDNTNIMKLSNVSKKSSRQNIKIISKSVSIVETPFISFINEESDLITIPNNTEFDRDMPLIEVSSLTM